MLQTPSLLIKYEGKAAAALAAEGEGATATKAKQGGTRVTFLRAREGVEITAGQDRRIVSDLADFDVEAETALFDGNVTATQEKNILRGGRLSIDRKAGKTRLETPGGGRILATFIPPAGAVRRPTKRPNPVETAQASLMGGFKADRDAPMTVEATLLELIDTANKAVFTGNVTARQGEMMLRTSQLTAFYSGKAGLGLSDTADSPVAGKGKGREKAEKTEIVRMEARQSVIVSTEEQSATAKWADFDVKANTALLGGGVTMDKMVPHPTDPTKNDAGRGGGRASAAGPHDRRLSGRVGADHAAGDRGGAKGWCGRRQGQGSRHVADDGLRARPHLRGVLPQSNQAEGLGCAEKEGPQGRWQLTRWLAPAPPRGWLWG